ncbi:phage major capsid protein [Bacillus cereus]|uniref:phage major capsid protein n=1 Tax=Bacillati TaxID=1783272 RepID=UPI000676CF81|nr:MULTISPECIES: phage major capsid protein [Bacillaceae]MEB8879340.1 phage major capsid protein [Bacillus cereus]AKR38532.1 Phage element PBSX protein XkdG [Bacillus thuringiensis serovar indiana]MBG9642270.1 phage portal protein [Bacillus thuringiensis]MBG9642329.1 phage portal protein [Bacillus thuringiensis]MBG9649105.1 phage portal protein [Bacillus thuringiensis]
MTNLLSNTAIIEKAAMSLSDLATGGRLNTEQANAFLRMVQNAPTILKDSRFVPMESDSRKVEKLGFGSRILRRGEEGTPLADKDLSVPTTGTVKLEAKEVIAEINITYDTLENNIEKGKLKETIMQMIAERAALDLEELIINGDTGSTDPYLSLLNGLRKQSKSHIVDHNGGAFAKEVFKAGYKALPAKYIRNKNDWRFYTSQGIEVEYLDSMSNRQTALGDAAINGGLPSAYGVPVKGIAMMQPYTSEEKVVSDIILTHPKNILLGMSRQISIEVDKDIRGRKFIIVLTAKVDTKFEEEDAVAKIINVKE